MRLLLLIGLWTAAELSAQDADYRVRGAPDAPVELTVYSDFECPFCRNFALVAQPGLLAEFVDPGLIRLRYVYFPLAAIHSNAVATAKAAHCAGVAGRFWAYHDYLYVRQPEWAAEAAPDSLWIAYAENLGLSTTEFADCLNARETLAVIESDLREALASGATGTPTIVINDHAISGLTSYEHLRSEVRAAIDAARR